MKTFILSFFAIVFTLIILSCKKEDVNFGKTGLNEQFHLETDGVDTFSLSTELLAEDSLVSSNLSSALLGSYNDVEFGLFQAGFYTEFQLSGLNPNFGDINHLSIDSVVLGLEFNGYYGNLDKQNFEIYELQDNLYLDSTYYSFQEKNTYNLNLVDPNKSSLIPDPINSTVISGIKVDPQLRIHLDTNFAKKIIMEAYLNPTSFSSNENFKKFFKGINVRVNNLNQASGKGGVLYFNLNDPLSKLTIYYKQSGVSKTFDLLINNECADFNHIKIANTSKVINSFLNPLNTHNEIYLQANKSRAHFMFPTLNNIPKNAIIHSAKLELPVTYYSLNPFYPSNELVASTKIKKSDIFYTSINQSATYSDYTKSYVFDLRDYIQQVVNNKIDNLGIFVNSKKILTSSERIVLNGINSANKKQPKLNIIYTIK